MTCTDVCSVSIFQEWSANISNSSGQREREREMSISIKTIDNRSTALKAQSEKSETARQFKLSVWSVHLLNLKAMRTFDGSFK